MASNFSLRRFRSLLLPLVLLFSLVSADAVSDLQAKGRPAVDAQIAKSSTCTEDKLQVRREWYDYPLEDFEML